jgi:hypothetical protein
MQRLQQLPGTKITYRAQDNSHDEQLLKKLRDSVLAPDVIELKKDAQVMLIKVPQLR